MSAADKSFVCTVKDEKWSNEINKYINEKYNTLFFDFNEKTKKYNQSPDINVMNELIDSFTSIKKVDYSKGTNIEEIKPILDELKKIRIPDKLTGTQEIDDQIKSSMDDFILNVTDIIKLLKNKGYHIKCNKKDGGSNVTDKYMKYLNKKTVVELKNIAKNKNIKITTKKEGKIVYLKKSAIIKKLCDFKHPKKAPKKAPKKVAKKVAKK